MPDKISRIKARIEPDALAIVRRAAHDAVEKTLAEVDLLRLSRKAQEQFANLLLHPPKPKLALRRALKRRRALIVWHSEKHRTHYGGLYIYTRWL